MKIAVTIAGEKAKRSAFAVWKGFEKSIRKASEYGFDGVELALKCADEVEPDCLRRWLSDYQMEVSCINTGRVFTDLGLNFTHLIPEKRKKTIGIFSELIDLAGEFGRTITVGQAKGCIEDGQDKAEAEKLFIDTMHILCDYAERKNVQVVIEPLNRYESNFINSLDEGTSVLEKIGRTNCGLHADVFHMNIEDDHVAKSLIRNQKWIRYVHLADSNRLSPGMGHLNFDEVMDAFKMIGYDGWVSMEMLSGDDPDWMAGKAISFMKLKVVEYILK